MAVRVSVVLLVIICSVSFAADDVKQWSEVVHARKLSKDDPKPVRPWIRLDPKKPNKVTFLTGSTAPLADCAKDRHWVIKGIELPDGETIKVIEMKPRTTWTGKVQAARAKPEDPFVPYIIWKPGYSINLRGTIAGIDECKKGDSWVVKGVQSADGKFIEVSEMVREPAGNGK